MTSRTTGIALLLGCLAALSQAQEMETLSAEIAQADANLFEAFNACDLTTMAGIFSDDLEFFHDESGLNDHEQTMAATRTNCDRDLGLKRELVEGSTEVFPVPKYGAIQKGRHTFCHPVDGRQDCGTFEFVHVWRRDQGAWKLTRVLSFGH
jgi:ketosteroid isomerase-like protein